jgi:hypothetical protein
MGTEYYIVKPEKKEIFYLGKHFNGFDKIPSTTYRKNLNEAEYPRYEDWEEFFWSTLKENWNYFLNSDLKLAQASGVIYQIYNWCASDKVILDHDCSESFNEWKDWKETGNITAILEKIHETPQLSDEAFIQELLEENESIIFENPSYKNALIGITTDGRAVYDYPLMVEDLMNEDNMDYEEAVEFIDYNTLGSLPQPETKYPIIIQERKM